MFREFDQLFDLIDHYREPFVTKKRFSDGTVELYENGRLHCETGPAVIKADGTKEYWLNGRQVSEQDVLKTEEFRVSLTKKERELVERVLGRKLK